MSLINHVKECLSNQSKYASLNAFISLADRASISHAATQNAPKHRSSSQFGQLIAVKDNICTANLPTTAASGSLKTFMSPYDATVVKQLRNAGAIIAGKTNMDEFGMGSHSTHSYFGPTKLNGPGDEEHSAGGSSGGSAIAVATGQCAAALGTDTGGSVRLPAAYCGVVGFKPSYGLLSRWGVIAYANSLDTVGILAPNVFTSRQLFHILNEYDAQDPTSLPHATRNRLQTCKRISRPLRIGIPVDYNTSTLDTTVKKTWIHTLHLLEAQGHSLESVSLPETRHALSAYYVLAPAEASSNLAKYDGVRYGSRAEGTDGTPESVLFANTRGQGFGAEVQRRILLGAFSLSAQAIDNYFIQAQKVRRLVQEDFDRVFSTPNPLVASLDKRAASDGVDVLVCPTAPTLAPALSVLKAQDPVDAYMNDIFTVPASLAGLPAISVPIPVPNPPAGSSLSSRERKQTVGIQVIGQYGSDNLVLDVAQEIETADSFSLQK